MAAKEASKSGKVVYIDPEGGFSTERLKQLCGPRFNEVLEKTLLVKPTSFDEQKTALAQADNLAAEGGVSLVVLDSIALLYRILEDKDIRDFGRMLAQLLRIARKYETPVLMLNQVYTDTDTGQITPVGGGINEYWSKIMVEAGVNENRTRFMILRKHTHKKEGEKIEYEITNDGIKPRK
jgi:DNA repair protein RadB